MLHFDIMITFDIRQVYMKPEVQAWLIYNLLFLGPQSAASLAFDTKSKINLIDMGEGPPGGLRKELLFFPSNTLMSLRISMYSPKNCIILPPNYVIFSYQLDAALVPMQRNTIDYDVKYTCYPEGLSIISAQHHIGFQ